jgi:hypothetical protein
MGEVYRAKQVITVSARMEHSRPTIRDGCREWRCIAKSSGNFHKATAFSSRRRQESCRLPTVNWVPGESKRDRTCFRAKRTSRGTGARPQSRNRTVKARRVVESPTGALLRTWPGGILARERVKPVHWQMTTTCANLRILSLSIAQFHIGCFQTTRGT